MITLNKLKQHSSGLLRLLEGTSHICVIIGIVVAISEYRDSQRNQSIQNSLSYILAFQSGEIAESRLWLQDQWIDKPLAAIAGKSGSDVIIDKFADDIIFPNDETRNSQHLVRVLDYLDFVATCVKKNVCEPLTIADHFDDYATNLYCLYLSPIRKLRDESALSSLGKAMQLVLVKHHSCGGN